MSSGRRTSQSSRKVRVSSPNSLDALLLKHEIEFQNDELTQEEYKKTLEIFRNNLDSNEFEIFKSDLDKALISKEDLNTKLSKGYYNELIILPIILYVFTSILPDLIKAKIPENIATFAIFALRMYNFQLLNYYYRFFVDPSNRGLKEVQEGKPLRLNQLVKIYSEALESSEQVSNFTENHYIIMKGLIDIKRDVETFMTRNNIFDQDSKNRYRFVFLYLAIFIVVVNFLSMVPQLQPLQQTSNQSLLGQNPRVSILDGGKKYIKSRKSNIKSNKPIKPKKQVATPKKATPKKATPKKATPKKATPKKATPKKATPKI
jgi:hypothetical protein